jgi:hypothetical protein
VDKTWKRYAFEGFMREEDKRYWKKTRELIRKTLKKIAMIMGVITAIQVITFYFLVFPPLHK